LIFMKHLSPVKIGDAYLKASLLVLIIAVSSFILKAKTQKLRRLKHGR